MNVPFFYWIAMKKNKKSCILGDRFSIFFALYMEGYINKLNY